jgi:lysophospholipase L1-like esterase
MKRRDFMQNTVIGGLTGFAINSRKSNGARAEELINLPKGMRILFQGDSITDAGRDRGNYYANEGRGMGSGYVYQIVAHLLATNPSAALQCFNRGISGHKVFQLAERWDLDCLSLRPDVLSILIGVNDYWHMLNGNYDGTREIYQRDFTALLESTKEAIPDVKLIICEPFAVKGGTAINEKWSDFDGYRTSAKEIAAKFDAEFVPFHHVFAEALQEAPADYWCPDGVHPSIAGAALMKDAWLEAFVRLAG